MSHESGRGSSLVAGMFGRIAPGYDAANRVLSLGVDTLWRRRLVRRVEASCKPGADRRILDLAAGTLDVSLALVRAVPGTRVIAMDFCLPMLLVGKQKLRRAGHYERERIALAVGDALRLPLPDACVDAVTLAFGLRNMTPRETAIREAHRVLKEGGAFHVLEFGTAKNRIFGGIYNAYLTRALPFIGGLVAKDKGAYAYLADTVVRFPDAPALGRELSEAGFAAVSWQKLWRGIVCIHSAVKAGGEA